MTEADWNSCTDPQKMLEFLRGKVSDRKLRLFACACCLRILKLIDEEVMRIALRAAEQLADGKVGADHLGLHRATVQQAFLSAKRAEYAAEAKAGFSDSAEYSK